MRRILIMAIAGLAGLLLVWLIVVRVPEPTAAPAKPVVHAPPPVSTVAPPATEPVAPKPAEVPAKPLVATETRPPEPPTPPEPPPKPAAETPSADTSANSDATADDSGTDSDTDDSGPPAIDTDHATDLLADMIAHEEAATDGDHLPNTSAQTLKKFDQESADANWSANAEQHIESTLGDWLDALPEDAQPHIALIHVECRATLCQVLAADNDPTTSGDRATAGHEWQTAIGTLPQQPWWRELGFVDLNTQVKPSDDYVLYMSYLLRETKAPPPADAPADGGDGGGASPDDGG